MLRKGNASPSLAADSADNMRRRFAGTFFVANFPPAGHASRRAFEEIAREKLTNNSCTYDWISWRKASGDDQSGNKV